MGDTVFVNGRAVIHKGSVGKAAATFPDVCKCPPSPPAGPVPTPLPNTVMAADVDGCAATVFAEGTPIAIESSFIARSTGNEVSKAMGGSVITGAAMGKAYFVSFSTNVLVEGQGVPRHMDMLTQNHASPPGSTPPGVWMSVSAPPAAPPDPGAVRVVTADEELHTLEVSFAQDLYEGDAWVIGTRGRITLGDGRAGDRNVDRNTLVADSGAADADLEFVGLKELLEQARSELATKVEWE